MFEENPTESERAFDQVLVAIAEAVAPLVHRHQGMHLALRAVADYAGDTCVEEIHFSPKPDGDVSVRFGPFFDLPVTVDPAGSLPPIAPRPSLNRAERRRRNRR